MFIRFFPYHSCTLSSDRLITPYTNNSPRLRTNVAPLYNKVCFYFLLFFFSILTKLHNVALLLHKCVHRFSALNQHSVLNKCTQHINFSLASNTLARTTFAFCLALSPAILYHHLTLLLLLTDLQKYI